MNTGMIVAGLLQTNETELTTEISTVLGLIDQVGAAYKRLEAVATSSQVKEWCLREQAGAHVDRRLLLHNLEYNEGVKLIGGVA